MDAAVWLPLLTVDTVSYFLYRGWRYSDSLAGDGRYARAREASRDRSTAEVVDDWTAPEVSADEVRCQRCGARNETTFEFCEDCATRLPDRQRPRGVTPPDN